uniref:Uncharacterized protein n=1 Tax=Rhizophora mucronata TaxID=61149 RepID=A0A2P2KZI3_RHIMU
MLVVFGLSAIRGEVGLPVHQEESKWSKVSCYWKEDSRGMFDFSLMFHLIV